MYQAGIDFMEHNSIRFNCIEWIDISSKDKVCVLGELCSAMKQAFLARDIVIEDALERAEYDYIILYHCELSKKLLRQCQEKIGKRGSIVLFQKNRYGATTLAGGSFDLNKLTTTQSTDTLADIQELLIESGIKQYQRYYPYPDSMFMTTLFSDTRLPKDGECNHNIRNIDRDRLVLLDEQKLYQKAILEGKFPDVANEFLFVIGEKFPTEYVRYSNDRAKKYQIKTEIYKIDDESFVSKKALDTKGEAHLQQMASSYKGLVAKYEKSGLSFVPCTQETDARVMFPFVQGESLADHMTSLLKDGHREAVLELFKRFVSLIDTKSTEPISNRDFIFSNILMGEDTWYVIDYEWLESSHIPTQELAFRAAYCYYLEQPDFPFSEAVQMLAISESRVKELQDQEVLFQKEVTNGALSFAAFRENIGVKAHTIEDIKRAFLLKTPEKRVQIYYNDGSGFCEEKSEFLYQCLTAPDEMQVRISLPVGSEMVRIDPCEEACIVKIKQVLLDDELQLWSKHIQINGTKCESRLAKKGEGYPEYIFPTTDPNIEITLPSEITAKPHTLKVIMEIHAISMEMAGNLCKQIRKIV